jgi:hypothetical protein
LPDTDNDGTPDFLDSDSDNDGYTDCEEGYKNADCSNIVVGDNGMASWVENSDIYWDTDHAVANGNVNDPDPNGGGDLIDEVTGNHEAAYREFLCGKTEYSLTALQWRLISIPCDVSTNNISINTLFGSILGTYGNDNNWVMYKQVGNYEVNSTHKNTDKTILSASDTLEQGVSYWIITDADHTVTIDKATITGLMPTTTQDASSVNISNSYFTKVAEITLPAASDTNAKKYMAGNPLPYSFDMSNLYFKHNSSGASYHSMEDNASNGDYINPVFYKHDSSETGPVSGYEAIEPSTPGLNAPILPMEGFFIRIETNSDTTNNNNFAYPLTMGNDN